MSVSGGQHTAHKLPPPILAPNRHTSRPATSPDGPLCVGARAAREGRHMQLYAAIEEKGGRGGGRELGGTRWLRHAWEMETKRME